ncbi:MAG TPA: AAA family ATPase [candidate division Zixibacteria bacterium]|nr:AAA family ATPase [candidate division Zixibacteria bacterium]
MTLPTGTVTFLFTDIEGSTRLAQALDDAWPSVLERHDRILREAVEQAGGQVFGTEGDAVFAVFRGAAEAVSAAVAAQRALAAEPWPPDAAVRVRMGLHTGEPRVSGDTYVGLELHRVARVTNAGHGGQVLLSGPTAALVESTLPDGVRMRDLGEHRLKDLSRPERLSMLVIDGLPSSFPSLRTLNAVPNNLPTQLTTFLGRELELAEAGALLRQARLLTLTGPGGTGKTRLALQLAANATDEFRDGVHFVQLGSLDEPSLVLPTIAQAMGLPDPHGRALEHLAEHLAGQRVLFVLDNFEQVLDAAPDLAALLERLPEARALVTSRSPLRVYGEQEYPVPPMDVPDPRRLPDDPAALAEYESVALFVERATAVQPSFRLDESNAAAIAEICARLDGLPLAIELAAARIRLLTPQAMLARLDDRLSLLAGGSRNLPERQQTLRGAIAWSYDLLEPGERVMFARFSPFAGGADVEAAERVALPGWPSDAGPAPDALEALSSLLDKSLIRQDMQADGEPRFRMLQTIREYAAERLAENEPHAATRARHAEYYLGVAEEAAARLFGDDQRGCLDVLEREHDNLRAAMAFAVEQGNAELAVRLLAASWRFWQMRGYLPEGRDRAERVLALLERSNADAATRLRAHEAAGGIAYWQGDMEHAREWYAAQRAAARELGDGAAEADAAYNQSMAFAVADEVPRALERGEEAAGLFRALGDRHGEARVLWGMASALGVAGRVEEGLPLLDRAEAVFREVGDRFTLAWSLYIKALAYISLRRLDQARPALEESLTIFRTTGDVSGYALVLDAIAAADWLAGNDERGLRLAGAAAAIQDVSGIGLAEVNREAARFYPAKLVEDPALAAAYAEGKRLTAEDAVALALEAARETTPAVRP